MFIQVLILFSLIKGQNSDKNKVFSMTKINMLIYIYRESKIKSCFM